MNNLTTLHPADILRNQKAAEKAAEMASIKAAEMANLHQRLDGIIDRKQGKLVAYLASIGINVTHDKYQGIAHDYDVEAILSLSIHNTIKLRLISEVGILQALINAYLA